MYRLYEDGTALVLCTGSCTMECNGCTGCQRKTEALFARNPEGARLGELVRIRSHGVRLLLAAFMLLVLPFAGFFGGYWLGAVLWGTGKWTGCVALAIGMGIGGIYDRFVASKRGSGFTVMRYPQNINKGDNGFD